MGNWEWLVACLCWVVIFWIVVFLQELSEVTGENMNFTIDLITQELSCELKVVLMISYTIFTVTFYEKRWPRLQCLIYCRDHRFMHALCIYVLGFLHSNDLKNFVICSDQWDLTCSLFNQSGAKWERIRWNIVSYYLQTWQVWRCRATEYSRNGFV